MSERDTHFQGFAKLLEQEIGEAYAKHVRSIESGVIYSGEAFAQEIYTLIARRAYDLVCHALQYMPNIEQIPDITAWDDETEQGE